MRDKTYFTPNEVAKLLMVAPVTVRQLAQKGELGSVTTPGGHRRFMRNEVERFAKKRGLVLQYPRDNTLRILIVDDDQQVSNWLATMLSSLSQKIEVETGHDGFDAGMKVLTFQPDILLLDLMMPGLSGLEVCRLLKEDPNTRAIRIIVMTGYQKHVSREDILEAGAEDYLAKPIDKGYLLELIGVEYKKMQHNSQ